MEEGAPRSKGSPVRNAWRVGQSGGVLVSMEDQSGGKSLGSSVVVRAVGSHGRCLSWSVTWSDMSFRKITLTDTVKA